MSFPHLTVSNYPTILEDMGVRWGVRSPIRPKLFSFDKTLSRSYSGVVVRSTLLEGVEAFWIRDSSSRTNAKAIHLVMCPRSRSDFYSSSNLGTVSFTKGMIYDYQYGTTPCHPFQFLRNSFELPNAACLDDFMAEASDELQDFVVKNILFNLE